MVIILDVGAGLGLVVPERKITEVERPKEMCRIVRGRVFF
jgi:hypothetical protein